MEGPQHPHEEGENQAQQPQPNLLRNSKREKKNNHVVIFMHQLPTELLLSVLELLDAASLLRFGATCRLFREVVTSEGSLWRSLCRQRWRSFAQFDEEEEGEVTSMSFLSATMRKQSHKGKKKEKEKKREKRREKKKEQDDSNDRKELQQQPEQRLTSSSASSASSYRYYYWKRRAVDKSWLSSTERLPSRTEMGTHRGQIFCMIADIANECLLTGGKEGDVKVWNVSNATSKEQEEQEERSCLATLHHHLSWVRCIAASDRVIATGSSDTNVCLWKPTQQLLREACDEPTEAIETASEATSSSATASSKAQKPLHIFSDHHPGSVWCCGLEGTTLVSGGTGPNTNTLAKLNVWDVEAAAHVMAVAKCNNAVCQLQLKEGYLATGSREGVSTLWDIRMPQKMNDVFNFSNGYNSRITALQLNTDQLTLVASSMESLHLWDLRTGLQRSAIETEQSASSSVASSNDISLSVGFSTFVYNPQEDTAIAACSNVDGGHQVLHCDFAKQSYECLYRHEGSVWNLHVDPIKIVSGGRDGLIKVWDVQKGQLSRSFEAHVGWISGLYCSPHEPNLYTCSTDHRMRCWSFASSSPENHEVRRRNGEVDKQKGCCLQ
ncbi:hypothetical protein QOT17_003277 [Balamuthia mandrillaris]